MRKSSKLSAVTNIANSEGVKSGLLTKVLVKSPDLTPSLFAMSVCRFIKIITIILTLFYQFPLHATPHYGGTLYYAALAKEPPDLLGGQIMLNYDPDQFHWRQFNVYFDGGYAHYWDKEHWANHVINIYSIAPVIRYTFKDRCYFQPYLEMSIGISYMDQTRIQKRNLGIHFAFQDRMGVGAFVGQQRQWLLGMVAVHFSNAHFSCHNSGISVPVEIYLGYRFSA